MKLKIMLVTLMTLLMLSCKKQDYLQDGYMGKGNGEVLQEVPGVGPDLAIRDLELNMWDGRPVAGLQAKDPVLILTSASPYWNRLLGVNGDFVRLQYDCLISNERPQDKSGINDALLLLTPENFDPIINSWVYDRFLVKKLYKDGVMIGNWVKEEFFVTTDEQRIGYDFSLQRNYGDDTTAIQAHGGDLYTNSVVIPSTNLVPEDGLYVLTAEVNKYDYLPEYNNSKSNNLGRLPFRISGGVATIDQTAMTTNKPAPVTNVTSSVNLKGRDKTVTLNWEGNAGWYCIVANGAIIYEGLEKTFVDHVRGGFKSKEYKILAMNQGIGNSTPVYITVTK